MGGPPEVGVLLSVKKRKHGPRTGAGCGAGGRRPASGPLCRESESAIGIAGASIVIE